MRLQTVLSATILLTVPVFALMGLGVWTPTQAADATSPEGSLVSFDAPAVTRALLQAQAAPHATVPAQQADATTTLKDWQETIAPLLLGPYTVGILFINGGPFTGTLTVTNIGSFAVVCDPTNGVPMVAVDVLTFSFSGGGYFVGIAFHAANVPAFPSFTI